MANSLSTGPKSQRRSGSACRVLVVEDHLDLARMMVLLLKTFRFETRMVQSGDMAYPAALAFRPHFVLLDIGLPGLNGYQVAELIRGDATLAGTILIAISAYGPDMLPDLTKRVRFDHYFTKPVDFDRLLPLLAG